jgi:hypothetical protein
MQPIEAAVMRTVLYGDVFDFPMTAAEIHHFLIHNQAVRKATIDKLLSTSSTLAQHLILDQPYIACNGREALIDIRRQREQQSQQVWDTAITYGRWLAWLPFVRMVAITGALAMRNNKAGDDYDYILITTPGRVWLARAFAILLVRICKLRGVTICPNYVLAANALEQTRKDIYIAHEITQMIPVYGQDLYFAMRSHNMWTSNHLPNAHAPLHDHHATAPARLPRTLKRLAEIVLTGRIGDTLDTWEHRRKIRRFQAELKTPNSSAQLDRTQVKGHFNDYGYRVIAAYEERLHQYGLNVLPLAGD